jgi:transporter family-2 protein
METILLASSALVVGCLLAVQTSVNQQLNRAVGTPYGASTLQLSVAAVVLALVAGVTGALGAVGRLAEVEHWWLLLGGVASPIYITAGILLFPRLGALTAVGLFVTGQVLASISLDLLGVLAVPRRELDLGMVLGGAAVVAGIAIVIRGQRPAAEPATVTGAAGRAVGGRNGATALATAPSARPDSRRASEWRWIALGIVAGGVLPVQGAFNAELKDDLEVPLAVGTISFLVATLTIGVVLAFLVMTGQTSPPQFAPLGQMPWWGWLGGLCAAAYVTATFLLIPRVGAAVTVALTVTGQQLASALIDERGWFRMPIRPISSPRFAGLALLIGGSVLVQLG